MSTTGGYCAACGQAMPAQARYCTSCGTAASASSTLAQDLTDGGKGYSTAMLNVVRLLSAASMFSAMYAAWQIGSRVSTGRVLIILGVLTAVSGQLFVMQASKATPPGWVNVPLTLLGIGLAALLIAWAVTLTSSAM